MVIHVLPCCFRKKNNPPITAGPTIAENPIKDISFKASTPSIAGSVIKIGLNINRCIIFQFNSNCDWIEISL